MNSGGFFDPEGLSTRIAEIEQLMAQSDFWSDQQRANSTIQTLKALKSLRQPVEQFERGLADTAELLNLTDSQDSQSLNHLAQEVAALEGQYNQLEIRQLLGGDQDSKDAILAIHSGAGGTESCDWAEMLLRMYQRWADQHNVATEMIEHLPGEEAGIKNATLIFKGPYAYGYLKGEEGVHRLVRISPYDANKRRHTSFVSVDVIPQIDETAEVELDMADVRIDVFRSGGKGGQSVNTTDSAVRLTHVPTGLVVQCQDERSQLQNKAKAFTVLKSRLAQLERRKQEEQQQKEYASKQKIEWGSQIRSYVLHPYNMVKDHRTDHETGNALGVLDGQLDPFMEAFLKWEAGRRTGQP